MAVQPFRILKALSFRYSSISKPLLSRGRGSRLVVLDRRAHHHAEFQERELALFSVGSGAVPATTSGENGNSNCADLHHCPSTTSERGAKEDAPGEARRNRCEATECLSRREDGSHMPHWRLSTEV